MGGRDRLGDGVESRWVTFGVPVRCVVDRWILRPGSGGGTHVVTEEAQAGPLPFAGRWWLRRGLLTWRQRWLEGLDRSLPRRR